MYVIGLSFLFLFYVLFLFLIRESLPERIWDKKTLERTGEGRGGGGVACGACSSLKLVRPVVVVKPSSLIP